MLSYVIIAILSYLLGVISVIIFSAIKISSKCSRKEEKEDFGQIAYDEIEKIEKNKNKKL